ncbi:MAG: hypothetical protein EPN56_02225 [Rhodanobacter sp.]|nr:MAG: hypothetical protein EPN78_04030 [Rhodanobacter sp.]TAM14618.1 MAG: hypothetical protein EPN66_01990 [Rhodanobacter sp.]TAM37410.1 MAG: hypothetical protein EPN56_02225 [Rhodanobacter sp.]
MSVSCWLRPLALTALLVVSALAAGHAQEAPSLAARMGAAAFHRAGLDQLSPQQLKVLEGWLAAHDGELARQRPLAAEGSATVAAERASRRAAPATASKPKLGRVAIRSTVAGAFRGWQPGAVLVLANGQRWRVADDSMLDTGKALDSPAVTIQPGLVGGWLLKVDGYNTAARVQPAN